MNYEIASSRVKEDVEKRRKIQLKLGSEAAKTAYKMVKMFGPKEPLLPGGELPNTPKQKVRARRAWLERQYGTSSESRLPGQIWSDYEAGARPMRWELIRQLAREISDMVGDFVHGSRAYEDGSKLMKAVRDPEADLCLMAYEDAVDVAALERILARLLHRYRGSKLITDRLRLERIFRKIAKPAFDKIGGDTVDDGGTVELPAAKTGLRTLPYANRSAQGKVKKTKSPTPKDDEKDFLNLIQTRDFLRHRAEQFDADIRSRFPDRADSTLEQVDPESKMQRLKAGRVRTVAESMP